MEANKEKHRQISESEAPSDETLLAALHELHREVDRRRTYLFRSMTAFAAFCGLTLGWVFSSNAQVSPIGMTPILLFIMLATVVGGYKAWGAVKSHSENAKAIVKISEKLGLYEGYYPTKWKSWGTRKEGWNVLVLCILGISTSLAIIVYSLPKTLYGKELSTPAPISAKENNGPLTIVEEQKSR